MLGQEREHHISILEPYVRGLGLRSCILSPNKERRQRNNLNVPVIMRIACVLLRSELLGIALAVILLTCDLNTSLDNLFRNIA
jgi:hypothetical protein